MYNDNLHMLYLQLSEPYDAVNKFYEELNKIFNAALEEVYEALKEFEEIRSNLLSYLESIIVALINIKETIRIFFDMELNVPKYVETRTTSTRSPPKEDWKTKMEVMYFIHEDNINKVAIYLMSFVIENWLIAPLIYAILSFLGIRLL